MTEQTSRATGNGRRAGPLELRLYVVRGAKNSSRALANLTAILQQHFADDFHLEVVDVLQDPRRALADGILVTPTLVKLSPAPRALVAGDLSQTERVLQALASSGGLEE